MNIPFLYVNITALFVYSLLLFIFLAAKKTPEIRAFLLMMVDCVLWTAGAMLMRLQVWPDPHFWYYVSLAAIFSLEFILIA